MKQPYHLTAIVESIMTQDVLDEVYMQSYASRQLMYCPIYGQISFNCCVSNVFILKLGYNLKQLMLEKKAATGNDIVEYESRQHKVITTSHIPAGSVPLLVS